MRTVLSLFSLFISVTLFSQRVVDVTSNNSAANGSLFYAVGGEPMNNAKYVAIVEGSPYYNEAFLPGKLMLSGGRIYDSLKLKLDLIDNTLHYLTPEGEELIATTPLRSVMFKNLAEKTETKFDNADFIAANPKPAAGWYQLLDTGTVTLYRRYVKTIKENKPYGIATVEQTISTASNYYILINAVFTQVKKIKQLPDMLQNKKAELTEFINSKGLTGKTDADYMAVISYYNRLALQK